MSLPPRFAWSIYEIAARWGCMPADVVGWAVTDKLELVTALPPCRTETGEHIGMAVIPAECLMAMFRRDGSGPRTTTIHRIRQTDPGSSWERVKEPEAGIVIHAADVMITNAVMERFEEEHGMTRRPSTRGGSTATWDWEAFWLAVVRRIHNYGLPPTQRELTLEMQDWFARRSSDGRAPDESTIGKKIREIWKQLHDESEDA